MDQVTLVREEIDAGLRFLSLFQKYLPVQTTFWLKESEGEWRLCVVSDQINDDNFDVAYGEVPRIVGVMGEPALDPFQVKLLGADDPLAKAVLEILRRAPQRTPVRLRERALGGVSFEEVYIYPSPVTVPVQ